MRRRQLVVLVPMLATEENGGEDGPISWKLEPVSGRATTPASRKNVMKVCSPRKKSMTPRAVRTPRTPRTARNGEDSSIFSVSSRSRSRTRKTRGRTMRRNHDAKHHNQARSFAPSPRPLTERVENQQQQEQHQSPADEAAESTSVAVTRTGRRRSRSRGPARRGRRLAPVHPNLFRSFAPSPRCSRANAIPALETPKGQGHAPGEPELNGEVHCEDLRSQTLYEAEVSGITAQFDHVLNATALGAEGNDIVKRVSFAAGSANQH